MQSSTDLFGDSDPQSPQPKVVIEACDKQRVAAEIDEIVAQGSSYLEATSQWLQENSIPESQVHKYVPQPIIEKITVECIDEGLLRPSLTKVNKQPTLDFMYD